MKYAVIKLDGKQFKVSEGQKIKVNRQPKITVQVLPYSNGNELLIGNPFLTDIQVKTSILGDEKGKKVTIQRFKAKSRYRVKKGHRQPLTVVRIDQINKEGEQKEVKVVKETKSSIAKSAKTEAKTKSKATEKTTSKVNKTLKKEEKR